jgi:hypothetical protein
MSIKLPNFNLNGDLEPCQENVINFINENFEIIDFTKSYSVQRVSDLPLTATTGDKVILDSNNNVYYWTDSWQEVTSKSGMVAYDETNSELIFFDGTAWNGITITGFEPSLGNPSSDGQILSSTVAGVRSWIDLPDVPLVYGYRIHFADNDIVRNSTDVFVQHTAASTDTIQLGDPGSVASGFVFSCSVNDASSTVVSDNSGTINFDPLRPSKLFDVANIGGGENIYSFMSLGTIWVQLGSSGSTANKTVDTFTGDGTTTVFTLSVTPASKNLTNVHVGRAYQEKSSYTLSGNQITISPAPINGVSIEVETLSSSDIGVPGDDTVSTAKIQDGAVTADKIPDVISERKFLLSDISLSTNPITALTYTIENGSSYECEVTAFITGTGTGTLIAQENGEDIFVIAGFSGSDIRQTTSFKFIARSTSLTFRFDIGGVKTLNGDGRKIETNVNLIKLPYNLVEGTL